MNDKDFEELKKKIRQHTLELLELQEQYFNEVGQKYVPSTCVSSRKIKQKSEASISKIEPLYL